MDIAGTIGSNDGAKSFSKCNSAMKFGGSIKKVKLSANLASDELVVALCNHALINPSCFPTWESGMTIIVESVATPKNHYHIAAAMLVCLDESIPSGELRLSQEAMTALNWEEAQIVNVQTARCDKIPVLDSVELTTEVVDIEIDESLKHVDIEKALSRRLRYISYVAGCTYLVKILGVLMILRAPESKDCTIGTISRKTNFHLNFSSTNESKKPNCPVGMEEAMMNVRTIIECAASEDICCRQLAPRSALVVGSCGSGKTLLLESVRDQCRTCLSSGSLSVTPTLVDCTRLLLEAEGGRSFFSKILKTLNDGGIHVVLIDHLDVISFYYRGSESNSVSTDVTLTRVVDWLSSLVKRSRNKSDRIIVIAACSEEHVKKIPRQFQNIASACGFETRINIPTPTQFQRAKIIQHLMTSHSISIDPLDSKFDAANVLSEYTAGFVARDIVRFIRSVHAEKLVKRKDGMKEDHMRLKDLIFYACSIHPSQLSLLDISSPSERQSLHGEEIEPWSRGIGGYTRVKSRLEQLISWNSSHPSQAFSGILLHGPTGCGKTLISNAVSRLCKCSFISVKASELLSMYLGESERLVRELFARANRAAPCVLFFDEIDAITKKRNLQGESFSDSSDNTGGLEARVLATLLNEMDGVGSSQGVLFLAATNRLDSIDLAILRPGRLGTLIPIDLPSRQDRLEVLQACTSSMPLSSSVSLDDIADSTQGCSCADLAAICAEAGLSALRENLEEHKHPKKEALFVEHHHFFVK